MTVADATLGAVQDYIARGWPVLPIRPGAKTPATRNGVKDATTDERQVLQWWDRWPDAGVGIATGGPGPTVLDIDDLERGRQVLTDLGGLGCPTVATSRGRHLYFRGLDQGTIALGYGELRGRGSYVIAPPSVHPSGTHYVWLDSPSGLTLPEVPLGLTGDRTTVGAGPARPVTQVAAGERHQHLSDRAVRLVRSGVTEVDQLVSYLNVEYQDRCSHTPPIDPGEIQSIARWAAGSNIAQRERAAQSFSLPSTPKGKGKAKAKDERASTAPGVDAPMSAHRAVVDAVGGWAPAQVKSVRRFGGSTQDPLVVYLTNGVAIRFERQGMVVQRGKWADEVIAATHGLARPETLKEDEMRDVFRSLCILAETPTVYQEADDLLDAVMALLAIAEPITRYSLATPQGRFELIDHLQKRPTWDPRDGAMQTQPVVIEDPADERKYLRAGELRTHLLSVGQTIPTGQLAGRLAEIGIAKAPMYGREARVAGHTTRRTAHTVLYQLPEVLGAVDA